MVDLSETQKLNNGHFKAEGVEYWLKDGLPHREDGPAIIRDKDGVQVLEWRLNGLEHREDGPAVMSEHVYTWWQHGMPYRKDGPSLIDFYDKTVMYHGTDSKGYPLEIVVERLNGDKEYYIREKNKPYVTKKRTPHPLKIELHRKDGPALIGADGYEEYRYFGQLHRDPEKGPAVIYPDGRVEYWLNGRPAKFRE